MQMFQRLLEKTDFSIETAPEVDSEFALLSPEEKGEVLVICAFAVSAVQAIREQLWRNSKVAKNDSHGLPEAVGDLFLRELNPLHFLAPQLQSLTPPELRALGARVDQLLHWLLMKSGALAQIEKFQLASAAMRKVAELVNFESGFEAGLLEYSMDRTFDTLDEILGIKYRGDLDARPETVTSERLYIGAGVGVQSSYVTILTALEQLRLRPGARLIDLGSGYGRVGFAVGLLSPEVEFIGYEYVGHRARSAQQSAVALGLPTKVQFREQDLADPHFQIPEADAYYMYDPFSRETYAHVLKQLKKVACSRPIVIVTNGDASQWLLESITGQGWQTPERFDRGTLGLFRSQTSCHVGPRR